VVQPDRVLGPADDGVTFFQPRGMVFVTMMWVAAAIWAPCLGVYVLVRAALGVDLRPADLVTVLESLLIIPVVAAGAGILAVWRRLGRLHTSVHHLEFAATGRRGVCLPWSAVASVGLRHRGVFTELIVTPVAMDAVTVAAGPGLPPRTRRRGGEVSFVVDVGLMSPGPRTLLAELHRRIPSKV
jgi:hypothetical protein